MQLALVPLALALPLVALALLLPGAQPGEPFRHLGQPYLCGQAPLLQVLHGVGTRADLALGLLDLRLQLLDALLALPAALERLAPEGVEPPDVLFEAGDLRAP